MSGFTKVNNRILEEVSTRKFNATQLTLLMIVWRMTDGYNRTDHELAVNYFVQATGFTKRNVQQALNSLIDMSVLREVQKASFNQTRRIAFNQNVDEWKVESRTIIQQVNNNSSDEQKYTSTGEQSSTSTGEQSFTQQRKVKENYKERLVTVNVPVPYSEYEKAFGTAPTLILLDDFNYWIDESKLKEPETIICEAIAIAKKNQANNPARYIKKIVDSWIKQDLLTLSDIQKNNAKFEARNKGKGNDIKLSDMFQQPTKERELTEQERKEIAELEEEMMF